MGRLERAGEGPGGYPIYERTKPAADDVSASPERRRFLKTAGATVASSALNIGVAGGLGKLAKENIENNEGLSRDFLTAVATFMKSAQRPNSAESLAAQFDPAEEPALLELIERGEVRTTLEVAEYFGNKPVVRAEEYSRIEYVQRISFDKDVVSGKEQLWGQVQMELRSIMPGLCAQESRFDNTAVSSVGARGIFQFMPDTWAELQAVCAREDGEGAEPISLLSLTDQTRAAGKHFSHIFKRLYHYAGDELDQIERIFFPQGDFAKYFLVPLMVNSFNAGSKRLSEAVIYMASVFDSQAAAEHWFERDSKWLGYDVFYTLAEEAEQKNDGSLKHYRTHASEYVPRIYAMQALLGK